MSGQSPLGEKSIASRDALLEGSDSPKDQVGTAGGPFPLNVHRKGIPTAILVTLLSMAFVTLFAFFQGVFSSPRSSILGLLVLGFSALTIFMILYTGQIHRWRRIYFSVLLGPFSSVRRCLPCP